MLGPYRIPGPVEPDSPLARPEIRCSAVRTLGCGAMPPQPPRFPASIGGAMALPPAPRAVPRGLLRALTAAATVLLLVASASLAAVASSVVIAELRVVAPRRRALAVGAPEQRGQGVESVQARAGGTAPGVSLAALGPETHAVDELWRRAAQLAREGADVTLVRTSLPAATTAAWERWPSYLRVEPEGHGARSTGLRIVALDGESAPALAGVRRGDVITAVNGYALGSPEESAKAFAGAGEAGAVVAEVERGGRRIALRIDWNG